MGIAQLKQFIQTRAAGGLSAKDAKDLIKLAAGADKKLSAAEKAQLQTVAKAYADKFTAKGAAALKELTGLVVKPVSNDTGTVPAGWKKLEGAAAASAFKELSDNGDGLNFRTRTGTEVELESDDFGALAKSHDITLLKNPKDYRGDPDDDTGALGPWFPAYHIQISPNGGLSPVASQLDKLASTSASAEKHINNALGKFHQVIHAARVNELSGPPDLKTIKGEVHAAVPGVKAAIAAFEVAHASWAKQAAQLKATPLSAEEATLVSAIIAAAEPTASSAGVSLDDVKAILIAQPLLLDKPEIMSIDPGFAGLRIEVLVPELVKRGGTYQGYEKKVQDQLKAAGIKTPVDVEAHLHLSNLLGEILQKILKPALGADCVNSYGTSGSPFDPNFSISFGVKAGGLAKANALLPQIEAALKPYGFENFSSRIHFNVDP